MPRIDKYLWAIRVFKTRSIAVDAIKGGKVKLEGENIKPARDVKIGDIYTIRQGIFQKTIKVVELLEKRLSAKEAAPFFEDLTPEDEYKKIENLKDYSFVYRDRGTGRPTKKDRRDIDEMLDDND